MFYHKQNVNDMARFNVGDKVAYTIDLRIKLMVVDDEGDTVRCLYHSAQTGKFEYIVLPTQAVVADTPR